MPWLTSSAISGPIHSLLQWELPLGCKSPQSSHDFPILLRKQGEIQALGHSLKMHWERREGCDPEIMQT